MSVGECSGVYLHATLLDPNGEPYIDPPSNPAGFAAQTRQAEAKIANGSDRLAFGDYIGAVDKAFAALNHLRNAVR